MYQLPHTTILSLASLRILLDPFLLSKFILWWLGWERTWQKNQVEILVIGLIEYSLEDQPNVDLNSSFTTHYFGLNFPIAEPEMKMREQGTLLRNMTPKWGVGKEENINKMEH